MGRSTVKIINSSGATINIAYSRLDEHCREECGDPWDVLAWVVLKNGEEDTLSNPTNNKFFYYYAESVDGSMIWSGVFPDEVADRAFHNCSCIGATDLYTVGFDELDTDVSPGVNFIP